MLLTTHFPSPKVNVAYMSEELKKKCIYADQCRGQHIANKTNGFLQKEDLYPEVLIGDITSAVITVVLVLPSILDGGCTRPGAVHKSTDKRPFVILVVHWVIRPCR